MKPALIVICGATATGKSDLALQLAERLSAPILSADSRQVYQTFDIGTAKPSKADRARAPHYLLDLYPPDRSFTMAEYQSLAQSLIADFQRQGKVPILVGGTGLYIQSVVQGLKIPRVPPQPELRSQFQSFSQSLLYRWLQQVDFASTAKIHPHDRARTLRALEVFYATGVPLSAQQGSNPPAYPILQIGLEMSDLDRHAVLIQRRTERMLDRGWVEEVKQIVEAYGPDLPLLQTLGYAELVRYLKGEWTLEAAIAAIVLHTRQFAKRQRTWFRADPGIQPFDALDERLGEAAWMAVKSFLSATQTCDSESSVKDRPALLK
ncbi:tRNA (adenosine(37)-N6)-dimethylallyltransferase MiaA [Altericista sp. CCNU0014]|uniref:tRNA (adenosine(37)-N6)-dimethylallyltransferase MiaA n=1 Tax=Altericista sp. CCNU0014 TaxID=3082949 RepID=UPI00384B0584